ncbi:MAG: hypothetical protein B7Z73_02850 [Planctomycetia bacterium 21-64-5]|nr:MAG: hypothetical protein B7Z73_02850 [Planctomycetia bacterium 21-64-5]HQU41795.1 DUF6174 domain-containing protein [Pirellulales bacterium]
MQDPAEDRNSAPPPRKRLRASDVLAGAAVGGLLALAATIAMVVVFRRQATPPLTTEALDAARTRWQQNGPADYALDVTVMGRQPGRYHVEVRDGKPVEVLRNGVRSDRRTWHYWTVPGLFEVIEHDVDCAEDPTRGFGAKPGSKAVLRAEFDERRGYPLKFERLILGEPQLDMTWEVEAYRDKLLAR